MAIRDRQLGQAAVQTLFASARAWDLPALLRELKGATGRWEKVTLESFVLQLLDYGRELAPLGFQLTIEGGRVNLTTIVLDEKLFAWLQSFHTTSMPTLISEAMLETLAIVAIRQPVTALEIERLAGVSRREILLRLETMQLIEGRSGQERGVSYVTTCQFLERFGADAVHRLREQLSVELSVS